jgi:hypothetical protein
MANTKGKIILGTMLVGVTGLFSFLIYRSIRNKRILNDIFDKLSDTTSAEGQQALLSDEDKLKGSYALDPNFWKQGRAGAKPNTDKLMTSATARKYAKEFNDNVGYGDLLSDETKLLATAKKHKTQGQLSQTAYAYGNAPLSYGSLADDLQTALKGGLLEKDYLTEFNTYITSLPL